MSTETPGQQPAPRGLILAAFAAIYLIWGSTYLGIRLAVETLPPFLMGGARFLIAGSVLYAWLRWTGTPAPARSHWKSAAIAGALMLGVGNGGVNWAEQTVPSNVTALLIAGTPLWFALLEGLGPVAPDPRRKPCSASASGLRALPCWSARAECHKAARSMRRVWWR